MRVITGNYEGSVNMAIDEYFLCSDDGNEDILRIYGWKPPCISIGYFQKAESVVDIQYCRKNNIDIVRRMTGGGTVYHDDELTYSVITNETKVPEDIVESFRFLSEPIIKALKEIGIDAGFEPINDICVSGKKISGNAQTRKNSRILQHGTVLLGFPEKGALALKTQLGKTKAKKRITTVKKELGNKPDIKLLKDLIIREFEDIFGKTYHKNLTEEELFNIRKNAEKFLI